MGRLVLWDIDHTLVSAGSVDHLAYRDVFFALTGTELTTYPPRGTGRTVPEAVRNMLAMNGVAAEEIPDLTTRALVLLPDSFEAHRAQMSVDGRVLPGAEDALRAVAQLDTVVASVVTGNLRDNAVCKLETFGLLEYLQTDIGAYGSDCSDRSELVVIARERASRRYGVEFVAQNTVIIGDSVEDVAAGRWGGAAVIGVCTGRTDGAELMSAGADIVLEDLSNAPAVVAAVLQLTDGRCEKVGIPMDRRLDDRPDSVP